MGTNPFDYVPDLKSPTAFKVERKRYYEIARGSIIEMDAALDIANDVEYLKNKNLPTS